MNKVLCFLIGTTILIGSTMFTACRKHDDKGNDDKGNERIESCSISAIRASVENGNAYNSQIDEVKLIIGYKDEEENDYEAASGNYANGGFTLTLPQTVDAKYLYRIGDDTDGGTIASDPNAKIYGGDHFGLYAYKNGVRVGVFDYGDENGILVNDAGLFYVDGDVTITGSHSEKSGDWTYINTYYLSLKKGWNMMFFIKTESEVNKIKIHVSTTKEPSGLKWYYYEQEKVSTVE